MKYKQTPACTISIINLNKTRNPPIDGARLYYSKISVRHWQWSRVKPWPNYSTRCWMDSFYALVCSVQLHFIAYKKQRFTSYPACLGGSPSSIMLWNFVILGKIFLKKFDPKPVETAFSTFFCNDFPLEVVSDVISGGPVGLECRLVFNSV